MFIVIILTILWTNSHNHGMMCQGWNPDYVFKSKGEKSTSSVYCCLLIIKLTPIFKLHWHCVCQEINPAEYRYMYSDRMSICNATTTNEWNRAHISSDKLLTESTWFLSLKSPQQWWNPAHLQRHQDSDNANQLSMSKCIVIFSSSISTTDLSAEKKNPTYNNLAPNERPVNTMCLK